MKKFFFPLPILLTIYFTFSLLTLFVWNYQGWNSITGDEPHYLIMASGLIEHRTFEQTAAYKEDFATRKIFDWGLPPETLPTPENTHALLGKHGLFNFHNVGFPLVISIPFLIYGTVGAKLFVIFLGGLTPLLGWKLSEIATKDLRTRFFSVLATCISLPLIIASTQIYPDMLAGIIALGGMYYLMTANYLRSRVEHGFLISAIVFLPWLQLKFAPTSLILVAALAWKFRQDAKNLARIGWLIAATLFSFLTLAYYNHYAFGNFLGPYQSGALELSKKSLMVELGLFFDQNQGFLFQNPASFIGLFFIGTFFVQNRLIFFTWALVFLSLIIPNGLHPNWYGGESFSGRFEWSAGIVFIIPTLFGLIKIAETRPRIFNIFIGLIVTLQIYFVCQALSGVDLYNRSAGGGMPWQENYTIFYAPLSFWLPAFYDVNRAFQYGPNYAWFFVIALTLLLGFTTPLYKRGPSTKLTTSSILSCALLILATGFIGEDKSQKSIFLGKDLGSLCGHIEDGSRVAQPDVDRANFLTFGPYFPLSKGHYKITLKYNSEAPHTQQIGTSDILDSDGKEIIASYPLFGTDGEDETLETSFSIKNWHSHRFEFRNYWNGSAKIAVHSLEIMHL